MTAVRVCRGNGSRRHNQQLDSWQHDMTQRSSLFTTALTSGVVLTVHQHIDQKFDLFRRTTGLDRMFTCRQNVDKLRFDRFPKSRPFSGRNWRCAAGFGVPRRSTVGNRLKFDCFDNEKQNTGAHTHVPLKKQLGRAELCFRTLEAFLNRCCATLNRCMSGCLLVGLFAYLVG